MTAITASSRRMMPTRQPIRMAVLLLSSLATGRPGLGVLAAKSGPRKKKVKRRYCWPARTPSVVFLYWVRVSARWHL